MAGPETGDWVARIDRELEPLRRSWQRLQPGIERFSKDVVAAREAWRPLRRGGGFAAARDRGDFRRFQVRLRLTAWMLQEIEDAKDNPSHRRSRMWLAMGQRSPKQIAGCCLICMLDMGELRMPRRRGRRKAAQPQTHRKWSSDWTSASSAPGSGRPRRRGLCLPSTASTVDPQGGGRPSGAGVEKSRFKITLI